MRLIVLLLPLLLGACGGLEPEEGGAPSPLGDHRGGLQHWGEMRSDGTITMRRDRYF